MVGGRSRELPAILVCVKIHLAPTIPWLVLRGHWSVLFPIPDPVGQKAGCSNCGESSLCPDAIDAAEDGGWLALKLRSISERKSACFLYFLYFPSLHFTESECRVR